MAERSFRKEVQSLRLGAGAEFRGEGILAVTKALLQSGVAYVGGYQGAPISHLMDVLADAEDILNELGVHFEASASEATAAAMLAASINYPLRGAVTWKSTVGTNVASDALSNLASAGVKGGALIILGEDYGEGASIMQERTHAFAMKSQMWLLDPRPASGRYRAHRRARLRAVRSQPYAGDARCCASAPATSTAASARKDNRRPAFSRGRCAGAAPPRLRPHHPAAVDLRAGAGEDRAAPAGCAAVHRGARPERDHRRASLRTSASSCRVACTTTLLRALELLGYADAFGTSRVPLYVLNVTYPLVAEEWLRFCSGKRAVLIVEEGQPEYHRAGGQPDPAPARRGRAPARQGAAAHAR